MASDKVNFSDAASIAQAMKYQVRIGAHWDELTPAAKEVLDQIATAIARTVSGDGTHWDAIIGYAHVAKPGAEPEKPLGSIERVSTDELERNIRKMASQIPNREREGDR